MQYCSITSVLHNKGNPMKQTRKRAPGAGRPPGKLGAKHATMTFRLPLNMRAALKMAARRKRRTLSEEIVIRLSTSLNRDRREDSRPPHIRALAEAVARTAFVLEQRTKLLWIEDRYTQEQLSKGVDFFLRTYSRGEAVVPPAITAEAAKNPADTFFVDRLGEMVAGGIIAFLKFPPAPPETDLGPGIEYPEEWRSTWWIEENLQPQQSRRQK
jgi:hypothetical protein